TLTPGAGNINLNIASTDIEVTGADAGGGPHVKVFNPDGSLRFSFFAYDTTFTGVVRVATGDVNGDGFADIITAAGPTGGPHVKVFNGTNLALVYSFFAFDVSYSGGVYVATGDLNGDGRSDLVASQGQGTTARVRVFNGATSALTADFLGFDSGPL